MKRLLWVNRAEGFAFALGMLSTVRDGRGFKIEAGEEGLFFSHLDFFNNIGAMGLQVLKVGRVQVTSATPLDLRDRMELLVGWVSCGVKYLRVFRGLWLSRS